MNTPIIAASHDAFAPAAQSVSKATTLQIKMIVGQWYTDEFGNQTRMIYNAKKPPTFEAP